MSHSYKSKWVSLSAKWPSSSLCSVPVVVALCSRASKVASRGSVVLVRLWSCRRCE